MWTKKQMNLKAPLPPVSSPPQTNDEAPQFDEGFRSVLHDLFVWRRDVRHFKADPVDDATLEGLLKEAALAPSVGYSQPWRFVTVEDPARRSAIADNFVTCNNEALEGYSGERAKLYAGLKLEGLTQAPVQLAVFTDHQTTSGHGLGSRTMPETFDYSTVMAVYTLWLAARAEGIGMGWVSILDAREVARVLEVPPSWRLTAYLCVGYPEEDNDTPELLREGWQEKDEAAAKILKR